MVLQCTLDLISWKILLQTCCLICLIRYDTIRWRAELSDSRRFRPYLNTEPVVKLLTHYISLEDLNRKWTRFCCFGSSLENWLNVHCIHDIGHLLRIIVIIFDKNVSGSKKIASLLSTVFRPKGTKSLTRTRHVFSRLSKVNSTRTLIHIKKVKVVSANDRVGE